MIEKKIHYVWLGNEKSDFVNACIICWKYVLHDYEFYEWNESNIDLEEISKKSPFIKECIDRKMWAFVSDYVRMYVLYNYGGIYLDTDITIIKSLSPLLDNQMFIGRESENLISAGVIGCIPRLQIIKSILDFYENKMMDSNLITIPQVITHISRKDGNFYKCCRVYPPEYFYPYYYNEKFKEKLLTQNTYAIHWWGKSWGEPKEIDFLISKHLKGIHYFLSRIKLYLRRLKIYKGNNV